MCSLISFLCWFGVLLERKVDRWVDKEIERYKERRTQRDREIERERPGPTDRGRTRVVVLMRFRIAHCSDLTLCLDSFDSLPDREKKKEKTEKGMER